MINTNLKKRLKSTKIDKNKNDKSYLSKQTKHGRVKRLTRLKHMIRKIIPNENKKPDQI